MFSELEGDMEDRCVFTGLSNQEWIHSEFVDTLLDRVIDFVEYPYQVFTKNE